MLKIENLEQLQHVMKLMNKHRINKLQIADFYLETSSPTPKKYNKNSPQSQQDQELSQLDDVLFAHENF